MEYCSHIWSGATLRSLSVLNRLQHRIKGLVGDALYSSLQPLSHRRNVASLSLFYRYYYGKCAKELQHLVPKQHIFRQNTRFAVSNANHSHYLLLPPTKHRFHERTFFPRTAALWNNLPANCFPKGYNLSVFNSNVNKCLSDDIL